MAKVRINPMSSNETTVEHSCNDKIIDIVNRVLIVNNLPDNASEYFEVFVNGYKIDKEFWEYTKIKDGNDILVATVPKGGNFGELLKIAAVIVVTAVVGPAAGGGIAGGLAAAGAAIGTMLLLNALIPPPGIGGNMGGSTTSAEGSQMYTITSQSNSVKKYGYVPKVYGRHRMFPLIAANPYTEIEADPETGELVQFFYAVYDFGFGPMTVDDIRIGDTSISNYADVNYRLVDFNKPDGVVGNPVRVIDNVNPAEDPDVITIDESFVTSPEKFYEVAYRLADGSTHISSVDILDSTRAKIITATEYPFVGDLIVWGEAGQISFDTLWDAILDNDLSFYKGDVQQEDLGVALNGNKASGDDVDEYQIIRNASSLGNGDPQEITLNLSCYSGLTSYATNGNRGDGNIDVTVSFAEDGTEDWIAFNDPTFVDNYTVVGGTDRGGFEESFDPAFRYVYEGFSGGSSEAKIDGLDLMSSQDNINLTLTSCPPMVFAALTNFTKINYPSYTLFQMQYDFYYKRKVFGFKKGRATIYSKTHIVVGSNIYINGEDAGIVKFSTYKPSHPTDFSDHYEITLESPLAKDYIMVDGYHMSEKNGVANPVVGDMLNLVTPGNDYVQGGGITNAFRNRGTGKLDPGFPGQDFNAKLLSAGRVTITGNNTNAVYSTIRLVPKVSKNYKVRIERIKTYSQYTYQETNDLSLMNIVTRFDRKPIQTKERHVFLELKIRATNQINGAVQNLNAICNSVLDVYDEDLSTWSPKITNNPAWVYADMLTGRVNRNRISKSRLDISSILEWSKFCDEVPVAPSNLPNYLKPRFECNFVLDFDTTLQSLINQITSAGQASLNVVDGKYGVLIDQKKDIPVQVFTPRNSWGFGSSRAYFESPDALKIKYVDPSSDWSVIETIVYDDGFDESTAETFDELQTFACTNDEQAFRFGRYMMAQARLRLETISINVDFEHLVCTRGDYVIITQDVMKVGGTPARVKAIDSGIPNRIIPDEGIETVGGASYGYTYRDQYGQFNTSTCTVINSRLIELDGAIPVVGDLIVIGEVGKVSYDCIVKTITPNNDLSAEITLVEKADAIYDAESSLDLPDYSPQLNADVSSEFASPGPIRNLTIDDNTYRCTGYDYEYFVQLSWNVPDGSAYEKFEVYVNNGTGFNITGFSDKAQFKYIVPVSDLGIEHSFKVLAVSSNGNKISLTEALTVSDTPLTKTDPPSDVASMDLNITGEVLQISWTRITDCDVDEYLIRYSPTSQGTWESSIPLSRADKNTSSTSVQARTGTYLIKAVDFNGNESVDTAQAITTIPELFNLNVIDETNDFPLLPGSLNQVEKSGNGLLLQEISNGDPSLAEYHSEGYYYYADFLDLGDIFTVRLQSLIEAEGFTNDDIMSSWISLDTVPFLSQARQAEWDVRTEVRYTDKFNVMSEWVTLDSIDDIGEGEEDNWSDWKDVLMSDYTARIFQFRLKLISNKASVTPRVFDGIIRADMPDRSFNIDNESIPVNGKNIVINPGFKGPSTGLNIQVTIDDAQTGDYHKLTNTTLSDFDLEIFDKNDVSVSRNVDIAIKGFGRKNPVVV